MSGYVAVYGTLKRGYGNHRYLHHLSFVCEAVSKDHFTMYGGGFPVVVEEPYHKVAVELYSIADLKQITDADRLERHPNWYERKLFVFETPTEGDLEAWMYVMPKHLCDRTKKVKTDQFNVAKWT